MLEKIKLFFSPKPQRYVIISYGVAMFGAKKARVLEETDKAYRVLEPMSNLREGTLRYDEKWFSKDCPFIKEVIMQ